MRRKLYSIQILIYGHLDEAVNRKLTADWDVDTRTEIQQYSTGTNGISVRTGIAINSAEVHLKLRGKTRKVQVAQTRGQVGAVAWPVLIF